LENLGVTSTATYDFDGNATQDKASEFFAAAGSRDTFIFTTMFENNVAIAGGEFGGDISDDRINLSALELNSIDDLIFTDVTGNVLITSEAFQGQILLVGVTTHEINDSDFIM
jgi:hypothetical protein